MNRRCLIVTSAEPAETGAPDWRRFLMLAAHYASTGMTVFGLCLREGPMPPEMIGHLRRSVDDFAVAGHDEASDAIAALERRWAFDVAHSADPDAPPDLLTCCARVRISDTPADGGGTSERWVGERQDSVDIFACFESGAVQRIRDKGISAVAAPYLGSAAPLFRSRPPRDHVLAGCWVERSPRAVKAVSAFFEQVRGRGGGAAPNFIVAGPGVRDVALPVLPVPIAMGAESLSERVFYRGIDLAICPDVPFSGDATPVRYDVITALQLGAKPLVSVSALTGLRESWRLPWFDDLYTMAEYVFERGRDLRAGTLLADLRARADWTWSGLSVVAARQRAELIRAIETAKDEKMRQGHDQ